MTIYSLLLVAVYMANLITACTYLSVSEPIYVSISFNMTYLTREYVFLLAWQTHFSVTVYMHDLFA